MKTSRIKNSAKLNPGQLLSAKADMAIYCIDNSNDEAATNELFIIVSKEHCSPQCGRNGFDIMRQASGKVSFWPLDYISENFMQVILK